METLNLIGLAGLLVCWMAMGYRRIDARDSLAYVEASRDAAAVPE